MFEKRTYQCPDCEAPVREEIADGRELTCHMCRRRYRVMLDEETGKAGFIEISQKRIPEPLYMPEGSIRAATTIAMALSCWILLVSGKDVPDYLLSLLLTLMAYYFGFRKKVKTAGSRIHDVSAKQEDPLFLPHGYVRFTLIAGFFISAFVLCIRGGFKQFKYVGFFLILLGLILGYVFAKMFADYKGRPIYVLVNHLKAVVVLIAAVYLAQMFLTGGHLHSKYFALVLSSVISFYFGSRS